LKNNLFFMQNTRILNVITALSINLIVMVVIIIGTSTGGGLNV
jgi:hypothetical protein